MYLYHATDRKNIESILSKGLLINPPKHNWSNMFCEGKIFLAFDCEDAKNYLMMSDNAPKDIVILKIKLDRLQSNKFDYDWNNKCEYDTDINSCVYKADIPNTCIEVCNNINDEPEQTVFDFKYTDLYDRIMNVFDEEVESNLENDSI